MNPLLHQDVMDARSAPELQDLLENGYINSRFYTCSVMSKKRNVQDWRGRKLAMRNQWEEQNLLVIRVQDNSN